HHHRHPAFPTRRSSDLPVIAVRDLSVRPDRPHVPLSIHKLRSPRSLRGEVRRHHKHVVRTNLNAQNPARNTPALNARTVPNLDLDRKSTRLNSSHVKIS